VYPASTKIGSFALSGLDVHTVPLDTAFLQSLIGTTDYAGISLRVVSGEYDTGSFYSLESSVADASKPNLIVETVQQPRAEIHGSKWSDLDGDGVWDQPDEPGLEGWTIFLDDDLDGVLDPGETSTTTAADGSYALTSLEPGTEPLYSFDANVIQLFLSGWF